MFRLGFRQMNLRPVRCVVLNHLLNKLVFGRILPVSKLYPAETQRGPAFTRIHLPHLPALIEAADDLTAEVGRVHFLHAGASGRVALESEKLPRRMVPPQGIG